MRLLLQLPTTVLLTTQLYPTTLFPQCAPYRIPSPTVLLTWHRSSTLNSTTTLQYPHNNPTVSLPYYSLCIDPQLHFGVVLAEADGHVEAAVLAPAGAGRQRALRHLDRAHLRN